ncbi:MAG: C40 family peptidase [Rhodobiaceae bacterium]|nr:C40 family peptidase [Rhodobiaceae bacterium]
MTDRTIIVAEARSWLGTPYHHGASVKGVGCDCLGLLAGVWRGLYGTLPEAIPAYTPDWGETDPAEPLLAAARRVLVPTETIAPGDVLLFRWRSGLAAKHLALATAPGRMIHAYDGAGVVEVTLAPQWRRRIAGIFSFPEIDP